LNKEKPRFAGLGNQKKRIYLANARGKTVEKEGDHIHEGVVGRVGIISPKDKNGAARGGGGVGFERERESHDLGGEVIGALLENILSWKGEGPTNDGSACTLEGLCTGGREGLHQRGFKLGELVGSGRDLSKGGNV